MQPKDTLNFQLNSKHDFRSYLRQSGHLEKWFGLKFNKREHTDFLAIPEASARKLKQRVAAGALYAYHRVTFGKARFEPKTVMALDHEITNGEVSAIRARLRSRGYALFERGARDGRQGTRAVWLTDRMSPMSAFFRAVRMRPKCERVTKRGRRSRSAKRNAVSP